MREHIDTNDTWLWTEINLGAIAHNVRQLRTIVHPGARLMTVVKADGYGHGATRVARTALENGADCLGVARIDEGISLRKTRIHAPILIFGYTPESRVRELFEYNLTPTVYTLDSARRLSREAEFLGKIIGVHVKVDTGMGRLGILHTQGASELDDVLPDFFIKELSRLPRIDIQGVFTHLANADSDDKRYTAMQLDLFSGFLDKFRALAVDPGICHAANSAATIDMPSSHLDMVRTGIATYGLSPWGKIKTSKLDLIPALTLKTRIVHTKWIPKGSYVGYGCTWKAGEKAQIATVPIGYADGLKRILSSRGHMLVGGQKAPIVGRICMDMAMLDISGIKNVRIGDEVIVLGRQGRHEIHADTVALEADTISYEILTTLGRRVLRTYTP